MFFKIEIGSYVLKITYLVETGSHVFLQQHSTLILPRREVSDHMTEEIGNVIKTLSSYLSLPVTVCFEAWGSFAHSWQFLPMIAMAWLPILSDP